MMKTILFAFCTSLLAMQLSHAENLSCADDYPQIISADMAQLTKELQQNDYTFLSQKTHPALIEWAGGPQAYQKTLQFAQQIMTQSNLEILEVNMQPPLYSYVVGQEEVCFLPKTITIKAAGQVIHAPPSFMVAIRSLDKHQWTYLDGAGFQKNPQMLYKFFPDFPKNVKVPMDMPAE